MEKKPPVPLMGRLAIHHQMITMDQLTEAVRVRGRPGEERNLGDVLLDLGFITQKQLVALVAAQRKVIAKHEEAKKQAAAPNEKPSRGPERRETGSGRDARAEAGQRAELALRVRGICVQRTYARRRAS